MKKLSYRELTSLEDYQMVDVREAQAFRRAFVPGSINLTLNNFEAYSQGVLDAELPIVWLVDQDDPNLIEQITETNQTHHNKGYIEWSAFPAEALKSIETISAEDFLSLDVDQYQLLDVRQAAEITRPAPKKNLLSVPLSDFKGFINQFDDKEKQYTLCGSGNRATTAASYLAKQGYQAIVIEGGMKSVQACQLALNSEQ